MRGLLLFALLICFSTLRSQPPQYFKYQSVLRDKKGSLLSNRIITVRLSILQGYTGGNIVYSEIQEARTNSFGMINLDIGRGIYKTGNKLEQ
jgi:hypothetical protein